MRTVITAIIMVLLFVCMDSLALEGRYMGYSWCPICGRDMPASHDFTHGMGSGGGGSSSYSTYNDPFVEMMTPMLQSMFSQIGQEMANSMYGDPQEEARQRAIAEAQRRQQEEEARRAAEELARQRRIAHEKLLASMKMIGTATGNLQLKTLGGNSIDWDGRRGGDLQIKSIDDDTSVVDLRPGGTSFFGTGGGPGGANPDMGNNDPMVVDLRNYQRASFLATAANNLPPQDRGLLIDEAVRAADGDTTFVANPPPRTVKISGEEGLKAFQQANRNYQDAQRGLEASRSRVNLAQRRVDVADEAVRRAEADLTQARLSGADTDIIAAKQKLVDDARRVLEMSRKEVEIANKDLEIAKDLEVVMGWYRRQHIVTMGGGQYSEPVDKEAESLSKLQRVYRRQTVPPLPEIPGWVARAEAGRRAADQVQRQEERLELMPPEQRELAEIQLERARHKAEMMDYYDRIINAQTAERVDAMRELDGIKSEASEEMKKFEQEALGTVEGAIGSFRQEYESSLTDPDFLTASQGLGLHEKVTELKNIQSDIKSFRETVDTGTADVDTKTKLVERANKVAISIADDLDLIAKNNPELARKAVGRAGFWVGAGYGLARTTNHTLEIVQLNQDMTMISDNLGQRARYSQQIQDMYKKQVDGFRAESAKFDKLMGTTVANR